MDNASFTSALLLATQTALLNRIAPSMRAILVRGDAINIRVRFVFHFAPSREDLQRVDEVKTALQEKFLGHKVTTFIDEDAFKKVEPYEDEVFVLSYSRWQNDQMYFNSEKTQFLNIDLDLRAKFDLSEITEALHPDIFMMNNEVMGFSTFEHAEQFNTIDEGIALFFKSVEKLPSSVRALWNQCDSRVMNVGIQAGIEPHSSHFLISDKSLELLRALQTSVEFTVYCVRVDKRQETTESN